MKVVAFNGSPRKGGNTLGSLQNVTGVLEKHGIETEILQVGGKLLHGCTDCGYCAKHKDGKCSIANDDMNGFIAKALEADGLLIGSPVYFGSVSPETKALIDRLGRVGKNSGLLRRKPGAAVVVHRRAGAALTYSEINMLFGITSMFTVGSIYWNMTQALAPGDWEQDAEGIDTFRELGENMAWFLNNVRK